MRRTSLKLIKKPPIKPCLKTHGVKKKKKYFTLRIKPLKLLLYTIENSSPVCSDKWEIHYHLPDFF